MFNPTNEKINNPLWINYLSDCQIGQEYKKNQFSSNILSVSKIYFGGESVFRNSYCWNKVNILSQKYFCGKWHYFIQFTCWKEATAIISVSF